jgi:hypothetical protein
MDGSSVRLIKHKHVRIKAVDVLVAIVAHYKQCVGVSVYYTVLLLCTALVVVVLIVAV